jgi:hypothetical protein
MTRHYGQRMELPTSDLFIPAHEWTTDRPAPDVNDRGSAFRTPSPQAAIDRYPCWKYQITSKRLISRYLVTLDAREVNDAITHYRSKFGEDAVTSIELHIWPETAQDKAGLLHAYGYERAIALESSGIDRVQELAFLTTRPRLWKPDATER